MIQPRALHLFQQPQRQSADVLPFAFLAGRFLSPCRRTCRAFTGSALLFLTGGGQSAKITRLRSFVEHAISPPSERPQARREGFADDANFRSEGTQNV